MGFDSPSHWAIVAVVVLLLFGYKKLPEMSRSLGRSLRIFKTEMKGLTDDDAARDANDSVPNAAPVSPAPASPVIVPPAPSVIPVASPAPGAHSAAPVDFAKLTAEPKTTEQMGA